MIQNLFDKLILMYNKWKYPIEKCPGCGVYPAEINSRGEAKDCGGCQAYNEHRGHF